MNTDSETVRDSIQEKKLLSGKIAIITGGAYGIGKAIAEDFLREGASVAIFDINLEKTNETVEALSTLGEVHGFIVDVANKDEIKKALDEVEVKIGKVNILVSNAGINPSGEVDDTSTKFWGPTLEINLMGAINATQIIGGRMKELEIKGSIVFISSVLTSQARSLDAPYEVSKHGIVGLMRATAVEWGRRGIRSNAVAPGVIYPTGISQDATKEQLQKISLQIPLGRTAIPNEIAPTVSFLSSDRALYVNGAEWRIDGGLSIKSPISDL